MTFGIISLLGLESCAVKKLITIAPVPNFHESDSFKVYKGNELISNSVTTIVTNVKLAEKTSFYVRRDGYKTVNLNMFFCLIRLGK